MLPTQVAGIGTAEGGLQDLSELLAHLPPEPGFALVVAKHGYSGPLADLLPRITALPVETAAEGTPIRSGTIYVAPPDGGVTLAGGTLRIGPRTSGLAHRPVDILLRSIAEECANRAIGVLLAGASPDGTLGLQAIKAAGGVTFAQANNSPLGLASGPADWTADIVAPPAQIAEELFRVSRTSYLNAPPLLSPEDTAEICAILAREAGIDFSGHDPLLLQTRVLRRMAIDGIDGARQFLLRIRSDAEARDALLQDLLIRRFGFFRDPAAFKTLRSSVYPELIARRRGDMLRIWVPACSGGEEVYSVAISLLEYLSEQGLNIPVRIFGTTVNVMALGRCRAAVYPESIEGEVSPARLARFFIKTHEGYQIAPAVRGLCVFSRQDVTREVPFANLDLIVFRDVFSTFGPALRDRVLEAFSFAIRAGGALVCGATDGVLTAPFLLPAKGKPNVYWKNGGPVRPAAERKPAAPGPSPLSPQPASNRDPVLRELQSAVAQLQLANEEILVGNEELRAVNEELTAAHDEDQSYSAELSALNAELQTRNHDLTATNRDLSNLLLNLRLPLLIAGVDLRIRRFTPQLGRILNIRPSDLGRPAGEFANKTDLADFEQLLLDTVQNLRLHERQVQDREGRKHWLSIRPYRTESNTIEGVIAVWLPLPPGDSAT